MPKITLDDVVGGYALSTINSNFQKIEDELNNKVFYRNNPEGEANALSSDVDSNSHRIYNLPEPILASEAARLQDVQNAISGVSTANLVANTPSGNIVATSVQAALNELDTEKVSKAELATTAGASLVGYLQSGSGAVARDAEDKLRDLKSISDFSSLAAAFTDLGGAEGTGYGADPVVLDLLGQEVTFTGTLYVPINVVLINGKLTSTAGRLVFRNPFLANTALRGYTEYWPYMKAAARAVIFNCLTTINCYIGMRFYGCRFNDQYSALVHVNSNSLWTEYTYYDGSCQFSGNAALGAAILFDGNKSGTSTYSTGTGAGTADGSFGYTVIADGSKIDSTAPVVGIKVTDGGKLYNSHIGLEGYARGAGPSGGTIYIDSATNVSAVNNCHINLRLESFGTAANILSISDNSQFWYNTGSIQSASPEMVMTQGALADIRSNDISVVGVALQDSAGSTVFNGASYMTKLTTHVSKREWSDPSFSAYPSVNQVFNSNVISLVTLGSEEWDTNSNFATSRFTPTVAGYYQVNTQLRLSATGTAAAGALWLYKNGAAYRTADIGPLGASMLRNISTLVYLDGDGDYLEMYAYVFDNGGNPSVVSGADNTFMNGCLMRKA